MRRHHRMRFGAEIDDGGTAHFRLWAPAAEHVDLVLEAGDGSRVLPMESTGEGWYETATPEAEAGARYRYRINGDLLVPDPASRFQPQDVHGPSELIEPRGYDWSDFEWRGRPWQDVVLYELHVGAFTPAGTFAGVLEKLDYLAELGVSAIELMPLSDAPGRRNWGYDGVLPFAPDSAYGRPDDLKVLIDAAHRRGLMVFLDVVYNHFGPEGNYIGAYAPQFFTERHHTPWGAAINFDGGFRAVREFFIENALYWIVEYNVDGLRLDAVHAIRDDSDPDVLVELAETVHARIGDGRHVHLVLENDDNVSRYIERRGDRPRFYDAQWNDDLHHALHTAVTGEKAGYYGDYADDPIHHLGTALATGFAYQGQPSRHRDGAPRGTRSGHLPPTAFVSFLQNHDQIGNRAMGDRIASLAAPEAVRAALAVLLLAPQAPLLFMGEEWGSTQPFPFFCDFGAELADKVREGRRREFARFPEFRDEAARARIPDPNAEATFASAVLDWRVPETEQGRAWLRFTRDLLDLRRREIVPLIPGIAAGAARFHRLAARAMTVSWRCADRAELWLACNLAPEPFEQAPILPLGRLLAATGVDAAAGQATGHWPAWSATWLLAEPEEQPTR